MHCTDERYEQWLASYRDSAAFQCGAYGYGCEPYHVMAPLLHRLGLFRSYEYYATTLQGPVEQMIRDGKTPSIFVAGVASEESARALLSAIGPTPCPPRVHFVDRCPTPLLRIEAALQPDEVARITTEVTDVLDPSWPGVERRYDIVVADSFLRQFPRAIKPDVLRRLAAAAEPGHGRLVFREYFGNTGALLTELWARLQSMPAVRGWMAGVDRLAAAAFERMLPHIKSYMSQVGGSYESCDDFVSDLAPAGLRVSELIAPAGKDYGIVSCVHAE